VISLFLSSISSYYPFLASALLNKNHRYGKGGRCLSEICDIATQLMSKAGGKKWRQSVGLCLDRGLLKRRLGIGKKS
jgi:hypothetical protein